MTVTFLKRTKPTLIPDVLSKIDTPIVEASKPSIPRGRGYLRNKKQVSQAPFVPQPQLKNTHSGGQRLADLLPREYNTYSVKPIETFDPLYYRCETCKDTKRVIVYDECEVCYGKGCKKCGGTGEVKNYINCQSCNRG